MRDSKTLDKRMDEATVTPEVVIPGTAELVDEVEESKITARRSATRSSTCPRSWPTWRARASSSTPWHPWWRPRTPSSRTRSTTRSQAAFDEVASLREGDSYPPYNELSAAQQREVKQTIEALAEPLARVQGTLGVKS